MNYRVEREHDDRLIELVKALEAEGQLDLLQQGFGIEHDLGALVRARRRRAFDVELTFENLSVVIETKVDHDEDGRWRDGKGEPKWQTSRIAAMAGSLGHLNENREFRFITYGSCEFYIKPIEGENGAEYRAGPYSAEFAHVGLSEMIGLVESADEILPHCEWRSEWLRLMRVEREKRDRAPRMLTSFARFREQYLGIDGGENDFPRQRLLFCAPELAFPVFHSIAREWNDSPHAAELGRAVIYPMGRRSPTVHDSIMNFWEMWDGGSRVYPGGSREEQAQLDLYFEINEDFNLNLKSGNGFWQENQARRLQLWDCLDDADWPPFVKGCRRDYKQGAYVYYEMDFGLLPNAEAIAQAVDNLAAALSTAIQAINGVEW